MRRLLIAGMMGAVMAAPIITPAVAQPVPTDPNGFSPFNTRETINENVNTPVLRNAPALGLSSIYGLNPCSLGASVGVTTPLFGIGGAVSTTDKDCEIRNTAALAITGLKDEAAGREILCIIKEFREAVARLGKPCIADQPPQRVASASSPQQQPLSVASTQPPATPVPVTSVAAIAPVVPVVAPDAPAFCRTPGLVLNAYPECTHPGIQAERHVQKTKGPQAAPTNVSIKPVPPAPVAPSETRAATLQRGSFPVATAVHQQVDSAPNVAHVVAPAEQAPVVLASSTAILNSTSLPSAAPRPSSLVADLLKRGAEMLAENDIVAARLLYQRAAQAGSAQAALEVGKTYDPQFLASIHAIGIDGDPATARAWYQRAKAMGQPKPADALRVAARD